MSNHFKINIFIIKISLVISTLFITLPAHTEECGISAAFVACSPCYSTLEKQRKCIETAKGAVNVVVANRNLNKGDVITEENVAARQLSSVYVHSMAIKEQDFDKIIGKKLAYPIKSGDFIMPPLLESQ